MLFRSGGFVCNQAGGVCGTSSGSDGSPLGSGQFYGQFTNYVGSGGDGAENNHTGLGGATGYATYGCGSAPDGPYASNTGYAAAATTNPQWYRGIFTCRFANNTGYVSSPYTGPRLPRQTIALVTDCTSKTFLIGHTTTNSSWQNSRAFYAPTNVRVTSAWALPFACTRNNTNWGLAGINPACFN